jgi:hypothetical protein
MSTTSLAGAARAPAYSERQKIGRAHLAIALKAALRGGHEITATLEACARIAWRHGIEPNDAIDLTLAVLPPHLARAALIGEIFRREYRR